MACNSPFFRQICGNWTPLPCGRCPPCKKRRTDGWVFRLLQEDKVSSSAHFVTLTYDPAHVPISPNGFMTLDKGEFPRFMKRLRNILSRGNDEFGKGLGPIPKLKYYACGEYGSKNKRPHYHAIVFNVPDPAMFFSAWRDKDGNHFGEVHVGDVSADSVAYTMKYIDKTGNSPGLFPGWRPFAGRDDRVPEFALMSKGMGKNYITSATIRWHNADLSRNYLTRDGNKIALPRYYRDRIFDDDTRAAMGTLAQIAAGNAESANYARFLKLHNADLSFDYQKFKDGQRTAVVNRFFSLLKQRN